MPVTIIHAEALKAHVEKALTQAIPGELSAQNGFYRLTHDMPVTRDVLNQLRQQFAIDINTLPQDFLHDQVQLLISDMDSTLISIECVDEIADYINIKPQVATITEAAMRGEIDFNTSLQRRVSLLKGVDASVLESVYQDRLKLNPGAEQLIAGLKKKRIVTALVSGGFTFFTERLKKKLQLDFTLSNVLDIREGKLTGTVLGDIVNAQVKANFLEKLSKEKNIDLKQTIAVGDGANDLLMMGLAGLGIAYRAKPKVQMQADAVLNYSGLDAILHFVHDKPG